MRSTPSRARVLLVALPVAALTSCSGSSGGVAPIGAPGAHAAEAATTSPASWVYHPSSAPVANAALVLDDGRCVVANAEGERWLIEPSSSDAATQPATRCQGEAVGAALGAPESLRRIVRTSAGLRFIGESGSLYEAPSPLAPFSRVVTPPTRLGRVATRGEATVGISSAGDPYWLERDGWVRGDGGGARLFDVEVDAAGRALAIAWPEQVLLSRDGGKTFRAPKTPPKPIGVVAVRAAPGAPLTAVGLRGQLAWSGADDTLTLQPKAAPSSADDLGVARITVSRVGPRAQAVAPARATITGARWYEVRAASELPVTGSPKGRPEGWVLLHGKLGSPLEVAPLGDVPADHEPRLGAHGPHVVVGTMEREEGDDRDAPLRLRLVASSDEGRTFHELARLEAPDIRQVRIAVGPNGDALVAGACPWIAPRAAPVAAPKGARGRSDDDACKPRAPVLVKVRQGAAAAKPGASTTAGRRTSAAVSVGVATDLRGQAMAPAFSADGATLYFLGQRAKGRETSIFRSDDGGASWSSRPVVRRGAEDEGIPTPRYDAEDGNNWEDHPRSPDSRIDLIPEEPLSVDAEGVLSVIVDTPAGHAILSAGPEGDVRGVGTAPDGNAMLASHGRRALAVSLEGRAVTTWESNDAGASWEPAGELRARFEDGEAALACGAGGCVVSDAVTRVGWGVREDDAHASVSPVQRPRPPSLRTPLTCDLDAKPWTLLEGIEVSAPFPTVDDLARGKSSWSLLAVDAARGAVTVHAATADGAEPPRLVSRPLLDPGTAGKTMAIRPSHQGEGYAVARVQEGKKTLEVAWMNFFDGVLGKRTLEPKVPVQTVREPSGTSLRIGLLSVATGGIFVQPGDARDVAFLDTRGGTTWASIPDWSALGVPGRVRIDATRIGGRIVHVGTLDAGPTVGLLAVDAGRGVAPTAEATTLAPPRAIGGASIVSWAYLGTTPGFLVVAADTSGDGWATATYRAFEDGGALGAPVAMPTALDLPDRPRPCRADEVKSTPRIEAPLLEPSTPNAMSRGQRHPVDVPGAGDASTADGTLRLLTAGAVLHGTPKDPCLAAWEATAFDGKRGAAVISGDLSRAWVFRFAAGTPPRGPMGGAAIEVHGMSCRYDPNAPVVTGAWDELGVK